jgi:hypothetical protein
MPPNISPPLEGAARGRANDLRHAKLTERLTEPNDSYPSRIQVSQLAEKQPERLNEGFCCSGCYQLCLPEELGGWNNKHSELCFPCADGPEPSFSDLRPKLFIAGIRQPNTAELTSLSRTRGISMPSIRRAVAEGFLWSRHDQRDGSLYLLTDSARVNISQRRWDNQLLPSIGKKAKTFPRSWSSWPIGTLEAADYSLVAIAEGGPDFLSLLAVKPSSVAPIMMTGASVSIPDEASEILSKKRVRVFAHSDDAGSKASERWMAQLDDVGCEVDRFTFYGLGDDVSDLNDAIRKGLRLNLFENFREGK